MTRASSYAVAFASPRRDSVQASVTTATGQVAWASAFSAMANADWPPTVLLWDDGIVVDTPYALMRFDAQGTQQWSQAKQTGTPVAVAQGQLYFKEKQRFLGALGPAQERPLASAPFPGAMGDDVKVPLLWPDEADFIAVLQSPGEFEVAEGDDPDTPLAGPVISVLRNRYATTYGDWRVRYDGELRLAPLLMPGPRIVALMREDMIRIDAGRGHELSRAAVPLDEIVDWSVDADEVYAFTGTVDGRKTLLALSAVGKELWRWTDSGDDDVDTWLTTQPPVRAPGGRVYVLTQGRVLAIEQGRLLWQYDTRNEALRHGASVDDGSFEIRDGRLFAIGSLRHATALGDGSVLVVGNRTLRHVSAQGHKLFSVSVDSDILSPPVVDAQGRIYVATASQLIRID